MSIKELKRLIHSYKENEISRKDFFAGLAAIEDELDEQRIISNHYKKIGRSGGNGSVRKWTDEEKERMVATKKQTLDKKK